MSQEYLDYKQAELAVVQARIALQQERRKNVNTYPGNSLQERGMAKDAACKSLKEVIDDAVLLCDAARITFEISQISME